MGNAKLTAVIIEDEQKSLDLLSDLITSNGSARVTGFTTNPDKAVDLISKLKPDIVFLDIRMPGKSGFEIVDELSEVKDIAPVIVFTTAFDEFAVRAFEYAAFDYLLKPIDPERLAITMKRCITLQQTGSVQKPEILKEVLNKLIYRNVSGILIIDPTELVYVEAAGNYSSFQLSDGRKETVTMSLGKVEEQLDPVFFFRTGRTFIINLRFLKKINSKN
ncbi:MAG: response regulator transcription factor [Bacteroidetes bacterium]|nr:response regulator transcription factor [Bacteroidota bacterium]